MMKTINRLWNGEIAPCDYCGRHDSEINNLIVLIERNGETLCSGLIRDQRCAFEKYKDCWEEYLQRMTESAFREGFCLAGNLLSEVFSKGEEQ